MKLIKRFSNLERFQEVVPVKLWAVLMVGLAFGLMGAAIVFLLNQFYLAETSIKDAIYYFVFGMLFYGIAVRFGVKEKERVKTTNNKKG